MKKIITTTSSLLTIFAISATAQSLSFTDGKTYDNLSSTYKDATLSAFEVKGGSKVVGADFSGATINGIITISNEDPNTGSKYNTLKDVSFAGAKINSGANFWLWAGTSKNYAISYDFVHLNNVDFSGASITSSNQMLSITYGATWNNVSFKNANIASNFTEGWSSIFWISGTKMTSVDMRNANITAKSANPYLVVLSGDDTYEANVMDIDCRGMKINGVDFDPGKHLTVNTGNGGVKSVVKNMLLADGTIYSAGTLTWSSVEPSFAVEDVNKGLMLEEEGDILTINGGEAILDISSDLKDGSLVLLNGAKMNIADNTTLSISQDIDIIVDSANVDISEIFGFGENASVVLSGVESDNALETLSGLIKYQDEDGNLISATLTDVNNIASSVLVAVPEPAEWAMIFGCIALGFAVYRRRK